MSAGVTLKDFQALHSQLRQEVHEELVALANLTAQVSTKLSSQLRDDMRAELHNFLERYSSTSPDLCGQQCVKPIFQVPHFAPPGTKLVSSGRELNSNTSESSWNSDLWAVHEGEWAVAETEALLGGEKCEKSEAHDRRPASRQISIESAYEGDEIVAEPNCFAHFVQSHAMDIISCSAIVLNAVLVGAETHYSSVHLEEEKPQFFDVADTVFVVAFTIELSLRFAAFGSAFFTMPTWLWNITDFSIVTIQLAELTMVKLQGHDALPAHIMPIIRLMRICRLARLVRLFRVLQELRTIVRSILGAMQPLMWTTFLMLMMIYVVAILITQAVVEYRLVHVGGDMNPDMERKFGSVIITALTLYESISSGLSWDDAIQPLIFINPALGLCYCLYIAFSIFAMMNVVTGVFVDRATFLANADREEHISKRLWHVLLKTSGATIDVDEFKNLVNHPEIKEFFTSVGASLEEEDAHKDAEVLFRLLDNDNSEEINKEEFLSGCMKLRGTARALDLLLHARACKVGMSTLGDNQKNMIEVMRKMDDRLNGISDTLRKSEAPMMARH